MLIQDYCNLASRKHLPAEPCSYRKAEGILTVYSLYTILYI